MEKTTAMKGDRLPEGVITVLAFTGVGIILFVLFFLFKEGFPLLRHASLLDILGGGYWYPTSDPPEFGMFPLILGSLGVTFLASIIALPISIGAAVFLSEICPSGLREWFKPVLEVLGFFPSVVLGFIGMVVIAPWMQRSFTLLSGLNLLNASLLMGVMVIPVVASLAEDSLGSVSQSLRDASYALGATRSETIWRVVVPAALPGILHAALLGILRAVGETMVVLMAAGGSAIIPQSIFDPVRPLTSTIAAEMGETPMGSDHYHALFFAGILLLVFTLFINAIAFWIEKKGRRMHS